MNDRKYYEAYDDRYKAVHERSIRWFSDEPSEIVARTIRKFSVSKTHSILEIGCGEGRDSAALLRGGYDLLASDISSEAISYCKTLYPEYQKNFKVVDCIKDKLEHKYDFIYAVAVLHMLVLDEDRNSFYRFIYDHLTDSGIALICSMGDGEMQIQSDISTAFDLQERCHKGEKLLVAGTSCRTVTFDFFEKEISDNSFEILEKGFTSVPSEFDRMMYAVIKKR